MGFDLMVLAMNADATASDARVMAARCQRDDHVEAELDCRIVGFYRELTERFPDHSPTPEDSPWAGTPLGTGVDHVSMCLRWGTVSDMAIQLIQRLAQRHGLVLYDPQGDDVYPPAPSHDAAAADPSTSR